MFDRKIFHTYFVPKDMQSNSDERSDGWKISMWTLPDRNRKTN